MLHLLMPFFLFYRHGGAVPVKGGSVMSGSCRTEITLPAQSASTNIKYFVVKQYARERRALANQSNIAKYGIENKDHALGMRDCMARIDT